MRYEVVKTASGLGAGLVEVEFETVGHELAAVVVKRPGGEALFSIRAGRYGSGVEVFRPAGPKTETRFEVRGVIGGVDVRKTFEEEHDAIRCRSELEESGVEDVAVVPIEVEVEGD